MPKRSLDDIERTRSVLVPVGDADTLTEVVRLSLRRDILTLAFPPGAHLTLRELKARGTAILYITHRIEELLEIADEVSVLRDGRHVATASARELKRADIIRLMVGRELGELGDHVGEAKGWHVCATARVQLGRIGAAEEALDCALAAARKANDTRRLTAVLADAPAGPVRQVRRGVRLRASAVRRCSSARNAGRLARAGEVAGASTRGQFHPGRRFLRQAPVENGQWALGSRPDG